MWFLRGTFSPVESIAHLNGDEHRKGHGHWVGRLKHVAVQAIKLWVVWGALEEVALWGGRQGSEGRRGRGKELRES